MAIVTVSRQIASLGDELCKSISEKLKFRFVSRKDIENKILELGFSESKLKKFDEKKPGFFASLTRDRDEYLDYLQAAIYDLASDDNCVIIGRGSFIILKDLPSHISLKFIADKTLRIERYMKEHGVSQKLAAKIVNESDTNRDGFHKSFFNFDRNDPAMFHLIVNTGLLEIDSISDSIQNLVKSAISKEKSQEGSKKLKQLSVSQNIINFLKYHQNLDVKFLRVSVADEKIMLHGISPSKENLEKVIKNTMEKFKSYNIVSDIKIDQNYTNQL